MCLLRWSVLGCFFDSVVLFMLFFWFLCCSCSLCILWRLVWSIVLIVGFVGICIVLLCFLGKVDGVDGVLGRKCYFLLFCVILCLVGVILFVMVCEIGFMWRCEGVKDVGMLLLMDVSDRRGCEGWWNRWL